MFKNNRIGLRIVIPVILGIMFAFGDDASNSEGKILTLRTAFFYKALLFCLLFVFLFIAVDSVVEKMKWNALEENREARFLRYEWTIKSVLKNAVIIFICWFPYIFFLFPGVYWSDTSKQLLIHYGVEEFTDHHPFALTYLFGAFADFGEQTFGNPILGLHCLIVLQLIAAIMLLSVTVLYTHKMGLSRRACHVELVFFVLFPVLPVMFCSLAKDTISVLFLMAFCLLFVEVIRTKGAIATNPWVIGGLFLCGLLTCLTKKAGVYVVVPSLVLAFLMVLSKKAKAILISVGMAVAVIMLILIPKCIMPALGVEPGGKQESIPFAIQQVAHDIKYNGDDMTEDEKGLVSDFLTIDYSKIADSYDPQIVDPVKGTKLKDESLFGDFIKLWIKKTVEHPLGHFESWIGLVKGWFGFQNNDGSPNYMVVCTESAWYYDPIMKYVPQWPVKASKSDTARSIYNMEQSVPVVNVLFSRSLWASILPCLMLFFALRPGKGKLGRVASMMPVDMSFVYLLLVPVSGMGGEPTRYVLQMICVAPLFLTLMAKSRSQENAEE